MTQVSASQQITADIKQKDIGSFPTERQNQFTLDSSGKQLFLNFLRQQRDQHFDQFLTMLLSGRGLIILLKNRYFRADISVLQARMVITYQFTPPSAGTGVYYASTEIVSPVLKLTRLTVSNIIG